ncbi:NUDIX domain-containing protein [bacterium]|nr:NUDIX domain-containing protein [bacterium]
MDEILAEGRFLRLRRKPSGWEYCERTNCHWAVVIAAMTDDRRLLLVEQTRPPVGGRVIELPAGLVGDSPELSEESWQVAARRELLEETGYTADRIEEVARGPLSPGLGTERIVLVCATGLRRVAAGGGVDSEDITVHEVGLDELDQWLHDRMVAGIQVDPKLYAGVYFLTR